MNLQTFARVVQDQYLSEQELAIIRKNATEMAKNIHTEPASTTLLKLLNHIGLITADNNYLQLRLKREMTK